MTTTGTTHHPQHTNTNMNSSTNEESVRSGSNRDRDRDRDYNININNNNNNDIDMNIALSQSNTNDSDVTNLYIHDDVIDNDAYATTNTTSNSNSIDIIDSSIDSIDIDTITSTDDNDDDAANTSMTVNTSIHSNVSEEDAILQQARAAAMEAAKLNISHSKSKSNKPIHHKHKHSKNPFHNIQLPGSGKIPGMGMGMNMGNHASVTAGDAKQRKLIEEKMHTIKIHEKKKKQLEQQIYLKSITDKFETMVQDVKDTGRVLNEKVAVAMGVESVVHNMNHKSGSSSKPDGLGLGVGSNSNSNSRSVSTASEVSNKDNDAAVTVTAESEKDAADRKSKAKPEIKLSPIYKPEPEPQPPTQPPQPAPQPPITLSAIVWKRRSGYGKYSATKAWERRQIVLVGGTKVQYFKIMKGDDCTVNTNNNINNNVGGSEGGSSNVGIRGGGDRPMGLGSKSGSGSGSALDEMNCMNASCVMDTASDSASASAAPTGTTTTIPATETTAYNNNSMLNDVSEVQVHVHGDMNITATPPQDQNTNTTTNTTKKNKNKNLWEQAVSNITKAQEQMNKNIQQISFKNTNAKDNSKESGNGKDNNNKQGQGGQEQAYSDSGHSSGDENDNEVQGQMKMKMGELSQMQMAYTHSQSHSHSHPMPLPRGEIDLIHDNAVVAAMNAEAPPRATSKSKQSVASSAETNTDANANNASTSASSASASFLDSISASLSASVTGSMNMTMPMTMASSPPTPFGISIVMNNNSSSSYVSSYASSSSSSANKWKFCFDTQREQMKWLMVLTEIVVRGSIDRANEDLVRKNKQLLTTTNSRGTGTGTGTGKGGASASGSGSGSPLQVARGGIANTNASSVGGNNGSEGSESGTSTGTGTSLAVGGVDASGWNNIESVSESETSSSSPKAAPTTSASPTMSRIPTSPNRIPNDGQGEELWKIDEQYSIRSILSADSKSGSALAVSAPVIAAPSQEMNGKNNEDIALEEKPFGEDLDDNDDASETTSSSLSSSSLSASSSPIAQLQQCIYTVSTMGPAELSLSGGNLCAMAGVLNLSLYVVYCCEKSKILFRFLLIMVNVIFWLLVVDNDGTRTRTKSAQNPLLCLLDKYVGNNNDDIHTRSNDKPGAKQRTNTKRQGSKTKMKSGNSSSKSSKKVLQKSSLENRTNDTKSRSRSSPLKKKRNARAQTMSNNSSSENTHTMINSNDNDNFKPIAGSSTRYVQDDDLSTHDPDFISWSKMEPQHVSVRSHGYLKTKKKIPAPDSMYEVIAVDALTSEERVKEIVSKVKLPKISFNDGNENDGTKFTRTWVSPDIFVISLAIPTAEPSITRPTTDGQGFTAIIYFKLKEQTRTILKRVTSPTYNPATDDEAIATSLDVQKNTVNAVKLFEEWCRESPNDDKMQGRFKLIPNVHNPDEIGLPSYISKYCGKPVLIKRKNVTGFFTNHPTINAMEFDVTLHCFPYLAKKALAYLKANVFAKAIPSLSYVIESRCDDELPEILIGDAIKIFGPDNDIMCDDDDFFAGIGKSNERANENEPNEEEDEVAAGLRDDDDDDDEKCDTNNKAVEAE